jgi:hypothetical protein
LRVDVAQRHDAAAGERADLGEQRVVRGRRHRRDEADRAEAVGEAGGVEDLLVGERLLADRPELRAGGERGAPAVVAVRRDAATVGAEDRLETPLDLVLHLAPVPEERDDAARAQDAVDLREGARAVEPVEGLRDRHAVGARVRQAGRLRAPRHRPCRRRDRRAHLGHRLDGDDVAAAGGQRARELARPGREVDDVAARQRRDERVDGVAGIARPPALVGGGGAGEARGGGGVDRLHGLRRA